jgi:hypothetical protein
MLNRLGKVARRNVAVSVGRVNAIVEKPRKFYVVEQPNVTFGLGAPVFTMEGKPVGVIVMRSIQTQGDVGWSSMLSGSNNMGILPIVLPFIDVMESAEQVPPFEEEAEAKSEE